MNIQEKLVGTKFGKLIVIGEYKSGTKSPRTSPTILCKCECGVEKRFDVNNLQAGKTKSCGCFRKENSSEMGKNFGKSGGLKQRKYIPIESSARDLFQKYLKRNPGNLTFEEFYKLTQLKCYHCGNTPHQIYLIKNATSDDKTSQFVYNGLDRVDTKRGYDKDNVVPCCGTCNFMRHKLSLSEFYKHIAKIVKYQKWDL